MQRLRDLRTPRPILPCFPISTQLHHFADASNSGYGCVTYLRAIAEHGIITSKLLYGRTRVASPVQHTIPRLELCAAALAIQVDATLTREISADIDIESSVYWTDSMIVLAYLQGDSKRYHTFVGNRGARIRSHYEASQWRHVPSEQNPADLASRGTLSVSHLASSEWFNGPKFLTQQESEWPSGDQLVPMLDSDVEVKRNVISHMAEASMPSMIDDIVNKFSKLRKVEHVMAWVMLFIQKSRKQSNDVKLSPKLIETAKVKLLINNQRDLNIADYQTFAPFKDDDGVVRVGGRLAFSCLDPLPYPRLS